MWVTKATFYMVEGNGNRVEYKKYLTATTAKGLSTKLMKEQLNSDSMSGIVSWGKMRELTKQEAKKWRMMA